jgi:hypothetical protein
MNREHERSPAYHRASDIVDWMALPQTLHYLLTRHVIDHGHVPPLEELARAAALTDEDTAEGLQDLAAMRGVILEPGSMRVWSLHPFAMLPTAHWVSIGDRGWWANCAWCSLAIGAALGREVTIKTSDGGERDVLEFTTDGKKTSRPDLLMHFPYPPVRWWDNPYCPCGNILFFSSEARIEEWCARHGRPKGQVLDMPKALALAERWFGDYASPDWTRKTPEQANAIFTELALTPEFWRL